MTRSPTAEEKSCFLKTAARSAAETIRSLRLGRKDLDGIGLRGRSAEAIWVMHADDLIAILETYALTPPSDATHAARAEAFEEAAGLVGERSYLREQIANELRALAQAERASSTARGASVEPTVRDLVQGRDMPVGIADCHDDCSRDLDHLENVAQPGASPEVPGSSNEPFSENPSKTPIQSQFSVLAPPTPPTDQDLALTVLREVEWSAEVDREEGGHEAGCPICGESKSDGHSPDCRLAKAIAADRGGDGRVAELEAVRKAATAVNEPAS